MMDDAQYGEYKNKITEYLSSVGGKGADTIINIGKQIGLKRREVSKVIVRMEQEGLVQPAGVTAGVAGYKLVAK
jgi:DNA-binding MarR family transcriptional regulator